MARWVRGCLRVTAALELLPQHGYDLSTDEVELLENHAEGQSGVIGEEQLAREQRPAPEKEELTLHARLSSQKAVGAGFNLYLDNGQVWRHEDRVLGSYLKDGDAITIEKGALGSYKLSRDAGKSRNWIRVTRVR